MAPVDCGLDHRGALIYGTLDMPAYGDPNAVIHQYAAPDFIRGTKEEFGIPNIVTAILGGYRYMIPSEKRR